MNNERAKYLGRRVQLEQDLKALEVRIKGTIDILRDKLDPILPVEALDEESIPVHAFELHEMIGTYKAGQSRLAAIKDILGE